MAKSHNAFLTSLGNTSVPLSHRSKQLIDVLAGAEQGNHEYTAIVEEAFKRLQHAAADTLAEQRAEVLGEILLKLESAPMRPATFVETATLPDAKLPHAMVALDSGEFGYVVIHNHQEAAKLKLGDRIVIDAEGKMLMSPASASEFQYGHETRLERRIDNRHIEVVNHQDEKVVLLADEKLVKEVETGKVPSGSAVVVSAGGQLAVRALPPADKTEHFFRFLDRGGVPDVIVDRDIGSPPRMIRQVGQHIREEMMRPELRRKFRLRPCKTWLLMGTTGSGKTLTMSAIHRLMYEIMSEVTKTPIEKLPHQVFRFRPSQVLSMWLGESDKNIDRIFDEVENRANETWTNAEGKPFKLPVLVIMEEADAMGRSRGDEPIYDRIMTTVLQRLDPNRSSLGQRLVIFLASTNEPHIMDAAFLRRIGGSIELFGRLNERGFAEVLRKHVEGLPAAEGGTSKKQWDRIVEAIQHALYDRDGDPGVVELQCADESRPIIKYRRDFVTGALIDRAVQEAATEAWEASIDNPKAGGLTAEQIMGALDRQVLSVAVQMCPQNAGHYVDLPEGTRVTRVRILAKKS